VRYKGIEFVIDVNVILQAYISGCANQIKN